MVARRTTCWTAAAVVIVPFFLFEAIMCASAYQTLIFLRVDKEWSPKDCHQGGSTWSLPLLGTVVYNISWTYGDCEQVAIRWHETAAMRALTLLFRAPDSPAACLHGSC